MGTEKGASAAQLARQVKKYLKEPDRLYRRVRDKYGNFVLSKNAKFYHPGRGVYRSSYKNAMRLARSEINMAYRQAENLRWQQMDFVVGYEIKLSSRHPHHDICDDLKGKYPKDFVWTGWHPNDMCYKVSVLKTEEEFWNDQWRGNQSTESVNVVTDVPPQFKQWVGDNASRIAKSNSLPYFISDNQRLVAEIETTLHPNAKIFDFINTPQFRTYASEFSKISPEVSNLYKRLNECPTQIGKALIANQIKHKCADLTVEQFKPAGIINDTFTLHSKNFNDIIQKGCKARLTKQGYDVAIDELRFDTISLKESHGVIFKYRIGQSPDFAFNAVDASKAINEYPPYLKHEIKSVSFLDWKCLADKYWKLEYNNPKHVSMATDGGHTVFWGTPRNKTEFKKYMAHEAGHILDGQKHLRSKSKGWQETIANDDAISAKSFKGKHRVSEYAKTNDSEDFAECIREYISDKETFKHFYPNRAAYIRSMAQDITKKLVSKGYFRRE